MPLIRFKRGATAGIVPSGLTYGEPAVNLADKLLYVGGKDGEPVIISGGGAGGTAEETRWSNPLPTTATNLAGVPAGTTFDVGTTAIAILERILYPYQNVSISNFNNGLASTYELGQTAQGQKTTSWNVTGPTANWVVNSGNISYSGLGQQGSLANGINLYDYDATPLYKENSVTYPALRGTVISNNTLTVSITGQQVSGTPTVSATDTTRWWSKMYWGKSTSTNITNPFAVGGGITNGLLITTTSTASRSITADSRDGYFYLFVHNYYELTSMTLGGFDVSLRDAIGSSGITTHSVMNAQGFTADYKVYRSSNELPGDLTIAIAYGPD